MFLLPEASAVVLALLLAEELAGATVTAKEIRWDQSMADQGYQREEKWLRALEARRPTKHKARAYRQSGR